MPVVFDEHHLSEVQNMASEEKLDQVVDSMKESKVALIGEELCSLSSKESCMCLRCFQRAGFLGLGNVFSSQRSS